MEDRKATHFVVLEEIEKLAKSLQESASNMDSWMRGLIPKDFDHIVEQDNITQFKAGLNELCRVLYSSLIPEEDSDIAVDCLRRCKRQLTLLRGECFSELKQHLENKGVISGFEYMMPLCHLEIVINRIKPPEDIVAYVEDLVTSRDYIDGEVWQILSLGLGFGLVESIPPDSEVFSRILELVKEHRPKLYRRMTERR